MKITARAARAGGGLLRPPRRQDDPDRPLHRPGARARAVHRRLVGARLPALHPVQHRRHRPLGHDVLRARLHLLALVRPGRAHRRPGDLRLRRDGRRDRRHRRGLPAARARSATGCSRTSATRSCARCSRSGGRVYRRVRPAGGALVAPAGALPLGPPHARRARARADHGAGRRRASASSCSCSTLVELAGDLGADAARHASCSTSATGCATRRARRRREGRHRARRVPDGRGARGRSRRCCSPSRRRWPELLVLVVGLVLIYVAVHLAKAAIDRPRPAGSAGRHRAARRIPSGHAAYATAWIAVARGAHAQARGLVSQRRARHRRRSCSPRRSALSRIYLRAHYWSDVAGGLGRSASGSSGCWRRSRWSSSTFATMAASARRPPEPASRARTMTTSISPAPRSRIALAAGLAVVVLRRL